MLHPEAGGAEKYVHEIGKRLAKDHEVTLLSARSPGLAEKEVIDGINIVRQGGKYSQYFRVAAFLLIHSKEYDVVVDDINGVPFFSPIFSRVPSVAIIHHLVGWPIFRKELAFPLSIIGFLGERSIPAVYSGRPFVTVSISSKNELEDFGIKESLISVIPNAIDFPCDTRSEKAPVPRIIYFGRVKDYKRLDHVIRALKEVKGAIPNVELVVAGRGELNSYVDLVTELGLGDSVRFLGEVDDEEKKRLLSTSWVFVTASMKEGWGISVIEANACGTPAVAYDVPGLRDSIRDGVTGRLVTDGDIQSLARALTSLVSDEALRTRLSNGSREWAKEFSWDKSAGDFEHLLRQSIDGKR
jgi:glycosyltransferase involved in cell wall biosynthesis